MKKKQTIHDDLDIDFSSESSSIGSVGSIEDFMIDDDDNVNENEVIEEEEEVTPSLLSDLDTDDSEKEESEVEVEVEAEKDNSSVKKEKTSKGDNLKIELEDEEEESNSTETPLNYKAIVKRLIDNKVWEGIDAIETEDGEQIPFDEVDIDEETFVEIFKQKKLEDEKRILENKISTEGISDFTKKLVEIEKNGGDVQQALESFQRIQNPLQSLDLTTKEGQQAALYLKYQAKGLEDAEIIKIIKGIQADGELEERAEEAKGQLQEAFNKQIDSINEQAIAKKEERKAVIKEYRNSLGSQLKGFELSDNYKKKLLDIATREDEDGRFEIDKIYTEMRKDPAKSAELLLFLTDKDAYLKQVTKEERREDKLKTMKTLKIINRGKKSNINIDNKGERSSSRDLIDLSSL